MPCPPLCPYSFSSSCSYSSLPSWACKFLEADLPMKSLGVLLTTLVSPAWLYSRWLSDPFFFLPSLKLILSYSPIYLCSNALMLFAMHDRWNQNKGLRPSTDRLKHVFLFFLLLSSSGKHFSVLTLSYSILSSSSQLPTQVVVQSCGNIVLRSSKIFWRSNETIFFSDFLFEIIMSFFCVKLWCLPWQNERAEQQRKHTHSYIGLKDKMIYTGELNFSNSKIQIK